MKPTTFELSVDTEELIRTLEQVLPGEVITYNQLSEAIGRNVQKEAYGLLATARKHLLDSGVAFETIPKVGLKHQERLVVMRGVMTETSKKVRSVVRREQRKLISVIPDEEYKKLSKEDQTTYNTARAMLGTLKELVKDKSVGKVEKATEEAQKALPLTQTLAALSN